MKLKDRLTLLRAGYSKSEIEEMVKMELEQHDTPSEDVETIKNENEAMKETIKNIQAENINTSELEVTKVTEDDVWAEFFGKPKRGDNK